MDGKVLKTSTAFFGLALLIMLLGVLLVVVPNGERSQAADNQTKTIDFDWEGKGDSTTCESGGQWHLVLSSSTSAVTVVSATLHVTWSEEGGDASAEASKIGGSTRFYIRGVGNVESAYAVVQYTGDPTGFNNLVISDVTCNFEPPTTTTTAPTTTTVAGDVTTTTEAESTTTTTVAGDVTTTTEAESTTTTTEVAGDVTTTTETESTTTTTEVAGDVTTTTEAESTTTTTEVAGDVTTTTEAESTTTTTKVAGDVTTTTGEGEVPSRVEAGGGGAALAGQDGLRGWRTTLLALSALLGIMALLVLYGGRATVATKRLVSMNRRNH